MLCTPRKCNMEIPFQCRSQRLKISWSVRDTFSEPSTRAGGGIPNGHRRPSPMSTRTATPTGKRRKTPPGKQNLQFAQSLTCSHENIDGIFENVLSPQLPTHEVDNCILIMWNRGPTSRLRVLLH